MNNDNKYCVYLHINPVKQEIFYIGIGCPKRPQRIDGRNKWWKHIVEKYGYSIVIIENNLSWDIACERERYYIKLIGRKDLGLGTLINLTDGGEGRIGYKYTKAQNRANSERQRGKKVSLETKRKISESLKKIGAGKWNKGKKHTEEWKKEHGERMKKRICTEETKKKLSESKKGEKIDKKF